jgi:hypothetical protein
MTKYRRKTANAKERERMKLVNQAFDRLRDVMPDLSLILDQEKETKVIVVPHRWHLLYCIPDFKPKERIGKKS